MKARIWLPLSVIALAVSGAALLIVTGEPIASRPTDRILRAVRVMPVETRSVTLSVLSEGTVSPRTESELVPEVAGRVVWTSPALVSGGYFDAGEPLLRIDSTDYEANVERARAALERALGEHEHAVQALRRQRDLATNSVVSDAKIDDATRQERVTGANLREARVALGQAGRDLERTEISAPFIGRVRDEKVDVGQFLNRGQSFATVYAIDAVEVRLPIADAQLAYLSLPIWERTTVAVEDMPVVTLTARFAGRDHVWHGKILRTEGQIDAKSRFVHVVARIDNDTESGQPQLPVGLFVQASIEGRTVSDVIVIPRSALYDGQVLVVDDEDRLRFRRVEVLRFEHDSAYVSSGLADGERICISSIHTPVDGMRVQPINDEGPAS